MYQVQWHLCVEFAAKPNGKRQLTKAKRTKMVTLNSDIKSDRLRSGLPSWTQSGKYRNSNSNIVERS
eukprot:6487966-Amphidinium_carterae.2